MSKSNFQTIVDIPEFPWKTGYHKLNLFMGSCFTENIGNKLAALKYPVDCNPFGILYNPMSVAEGLECLLSKKVFTKEDLVQHNGLWHSYAHHGRFSANTSEECLEKVNSRLQYSSQSLNEAGFLFITFGTAWVYRNKNGNIVANCHKIPAREFVRERMGVGSIVETYTELLQDIWAKNPGLKVVFTVSPIRHWKDGAVENQRSKATLLLAVEQIIANFGFDKCAYFPSYEIVMDELRDYRFYANDMLHISDVAIDHIWSIFEDSLIDQESKSLAKEIQKIINAMNHRPINENSKEFLKFLNQFRDKTVLLEKKLPDLNFSRENEYFSSRLHELSKL